VIGRVYLWDSCVAVVTEGPALPRRRGSTLGPEACKSDPDRQVYTLAVLHDSGAVMWPVERFPETLLKWEERGRLVHR
jgi:hypothetical protein